jgi:hypothetical protein
MTARGLIGTRPAHPEIHLPPLLAALAAGVAAVCLGFLIFCVYEFCHSIQHLVSSRRAACCGG